MLRNLSTTSAVIDELGGNTAVARLLNIKAKRVSNWRGAQFPTHTYRGLLDALAKRGCTAPDRLWPMTKVDLRFVKRADLNAAA